ncbi:FecR family protein [Dyadobacter tibetensis]|uniref:FecR family protein n=1 Tax=Dyadobacter tibetensis TaxID=1211851 RepID=UPI00046F7EF2|nr:FecR family protein [Dyadobacter tibetensis]
MSDENYQLDDFLSDEYFKRWVLSPDVESDRYWNDYLLRNPDKRAVMRHARFLLIQLHQDLDQLKPREYQVESMWDQIEKQTLSQPSHPKSLWARMPRWTASVAAAMILVVIGWLAWSNLTINEYSYACQTASIQHSLTEKINEGQGDLLVILPDSSRITLKPHSRVSFPIAFNGSDKREVYLTGEAFFQVSKNINRPFYVYSHELVTKVLGTSFTIKAFEKSKELEVIVTTGKVSVYSRKSLMESILENKESEATTMITPNQRVQYSRSHEALQKSLVDKPVPLPSAKWTDMPNSFREVPVGKIFDTIQRAYGIDIQYDPVAHGDCLLTASFGKETLFEKIDLICKGIEATYRIENAQFIIEGRGCH